MQIKKVAGGFLFIALIASGAIAGTTQGILEGHLIIASPKPVELAEGNTPGITSGMYSKYPLVILARDTKREVTSIKADEKGNYRIELPPGEYILDVQGRAPKHIRAKPQQFTVVPDQTVKVDMKIDTGIR